MLYREGYISFKVLSPLQRSSQNLVWFPLWTLDFLFERKKSLISIRHPQKKTWEETCDRVLFPKYFLFINLCQMSSSFKSLKSHFLKRQMFCASRSIMPISPPLFALLKMLHLISLYFFSYDHRIAIKCGICNSPNFLEPL